MPSEGPMEKFADFLASRDGCESLVELGVGFNFKVALRLRELGKEVVVIDRNEEAVGTAEKLGLKAYVDDLFHPKLDVYPNVDVLYSVRPTPELVPAIVRLSNLLNVPLYILPFSGDVVPGRLINYMGVPIYTLNVEKHI